MSVKRSGLTDSCEHMLATKNEPVVGRGRLISTDRGEAFGIEPDCLKPLLPNSTSVAGYVAQPAANLPKFETAEADGEQFREEAIGDRSRGRRREWRRCWEPSGLADLITKRFGSFT